MTKAFIEKYWNEIAEKLEEANKTAAENPHLQFSVYFYPSGEVDIFEDIAGGNSYRNDDHETVKTFCYQYNDNDDPDEIDTTDIIRDFIAEQEYKEQY